MNMMTRPLLLAAVATLASGAVLAQPAKMSELQLDRVVAGLDGRGNGNGNGNVGDFNGNGNAGNGNGNGNVGDLNGNGNAGNFNGNGNVGDLHGNNVAGNGMGNGNVGDAPGALTIDVDTGIPASLPVQIGEPPQLQLPPGWAGGPHLDSFGPPRDMVAGTSLPLSLGWVPALPRP